MHRIAELARQARGKAEEIVGLLDDGDPGKVNHSLGELIGMLDVIQTRATNGISATVRPAERHHTANDISHEVASFTVKSEDDEFNCPMCQVRVEVGETGYAHHHHEFCSQGCAKEHQIVMARRPVKVGP